MMKLAMAPLHPDLKPTVSFEQGDQFLDFHANSLPWALGRGLTYANRYERHRVVAEDVDNFDRDRVPFWPLVDVLNGRQSKSTAQ